MNRESVRSELRRAFEAMSGMPSPALSARVRGALLQGPGERRAPFWAAGLAAALIAAIVVSVLVVSNLSRHQSNVGPVTHPSPTASAVQTTPSPTPRLTPTPSSNLPAFVCAPTSLNPAPAPLTAYINDVRTGTHGGYDRITITFQNGLPGSIKLLPQASATFASGGGKGGNVTIAGHAGILVTLIGADEHTDYTGPTDFKTGYAVLVEARQIQDFEGYVQWALGLSHSACYRAFTLTNPIRLVIDVQVS